MTFCGKSWKAQAALAGAIGFSCIVAQLSLLREMLNVFAGNELVLGIGMGSWFLLSGIGAALGRNARRLDPARVVRFGLVLLALLPPVQIVLLRVFCHTFFLRGAEIGVSGIAVSTLLLLAPYCVLSGFLLPVACRVGSEEVNASTRVYVADSVGSIVGGLAFTFVLVRSSDHFALLSAAALVPLLVVAGAAVSDRRWLFSLGTSGIAAGIALLCLWGDVDTWSSNVQWSHGSPEFRRPVEWSASSPYGKLIALGMENRGVAFVLNGYFAASSWDSTDSEESVHYTMSQRPAARKVLLIGGIASRALVEALKYHDCRVTCVELDPNIIEGTRRFFPEVLASPRVKVVNTDGRLFLARTPERFDVILIDLPDPTNVQLARYYSAEFFTVAKRALVPGGVLGFQLASYENYVSPELGSIAASGWRTLKSAFSNGLVLPGQRRMVFLGSDGALTLNIADRLEAGGIRTRLVKRSYIETMFAPDRLADVQRAIGHPASISTDFHPVLCAYGLRRWISTTGSVPDAIPWLLLAPFGIYLLRLRPAPLTVFASGFTGSSLSLVAILAFQVFYGSIYERIGWIVTAFMAGLAVGAWAGSKTPSALGRAFSPDARYAQKGSAGILPAVAGILPASGEGDGPGACTTPAGKDADGSGQDARAPLRPCATTSWGHLSKVHTQIWSLGTSTLLAATAFALAALSFMFPLYLQAHAASDGFGLPNAVAETLIPVLMFLLAAVVGMQFPLAVAIESGCGAASRVYTADFVGASLGAFVTGACTIPMFGVGKTCILAGALNAAAGMALLLRRKTS